MQNLRKAGEASETRPRPPGSGHTRRESARTIVGEEEKTSSLRDELKDAEVGLGRAKEEYRRLQKEVCTPLLILCLYSQRILPKLAEATERIHTLTTENAELLSLHRQEIAAIHDNQQMLTLQQELEDTRSENHRLLDKVNLISSLLKCLLTLKIVGASSRAGDGAYERGILTISSSG